MRSGPACAGSGPDGDPARRSGDDPQDWEAYLASGFDQDEPPDPDEEYLDPEHPAMPPDFDLAAIDAETRRIAAEEAADDERLAARGDLAAIAAGIRGRRGPGQPGSARRVPGRSSGPAGGFRSSVTPRALTWKRLQQPGSRASALVTGCSPCLNTHNKCTGVCRFVRGIPVGIGRRVGGLWSSVGSREAP